jgi:hypothetical protein
MKIIGIVLLLIGLVLLISQIGSWMLANNQYKNEIYNYWSLADKASTIDAKSQYINKFVEALDNSGLKGKYNAVYLKNPDNSFDKNLEMLKTLQTRLYEIKTMNVSSFEYQQAISQITAQEQGEAKNMLDVFEGVWYLENHTWIWDWIAFLWLIFEIVLICIGVTMIYQD